MEIQDLNRSVNIQVNGQPVEIELTFDCNEDDIQHDDPAFEPSEGCFCCYVLVTAKAYDLEGSDSLGGCDVRCNNMFDSRGFESDINDIINEHGMVESAIDDLKKQLIKEYQRLTNQAETYKVFAS